MTIKKVTFKNKSYQLIRNLYYEAFPQKERIPFELLVLRSSAEWIDFFAFYDNGRFCGFAYLISSDTLTSIMYLAVDKELRSSGYGSRILNFIRKRYKDHTLALEIEMPHNKAENYLQQVQRKKFYIRNGFSESGYEVNINKVEYEVLKSRADFQKSEWEKLTERLSFGILKIKLYKTKTKNV